MDDHIQILRAALQDDPLNLAIHMELLASLKQAGQEVEVLQAGMAALEHFQDHEELIVTVALSALKLEQPETARNVLGGYVERHRQNEKLIALLAEVTRLSVPGLDAEIELVANCQLSCPFCRTGKDLKHKYPEILRGRMSRETFLKILDQTPLRNVLLYNWGEPFLHTDLLWFVQTAKARGIHIELSSNMQIMTPELAKGLVEAGLDMIRVSCDGMTQESYEKYRVGGSLEKVLTHAKILADAKKASGSSVPQIAFQFVVNRFNEHEVEHFEAFAQKYGADCVNFLNICSLTPEGYQQVDAFEPINPRWKKFWNMGTMTSCPQPWTHITFDWNGDVYPCCNPSGIQKYKLGNINDKSFSEVYNNSKYQYTRRFCASGTPEENGMEIMCHACYNKFPNQQMREADMYSKCLPAAIPSFTNSRS